jgi:hypothetical protein
MGMLGILNQTIWILIRFFGICWKFNEWARAKIFVNSSNNVNHNSAPFSHPITGKYTVVSLSIQLIIYPSPSEGTSSHIDSKCSVRVLWNWKLNKWHRIILVIVLNPEELLYLTRQQIMFSVMYNTDFTKAFCTFKMPYGTMLHTSM